MRQIIYKQLCGDIEIAEWLADENKLAALKAEYPPPRYSASVDMFAKQIVVTEHELGKSCSVLN